MNCENVCSEGVKGWGTGGEFLARVCHARAFPANLHFLLSQPSQQKALQLVEFSYASLFFSVQCAPSLEHFSDHVAHLGTKNSLDVKFCPKEARFSLWVREL